MTMGFPCRAFPFVVTHQCRFHECDLENQSLIVLRSHQNIPPQEFVADSLSFDLPLDYNFGGVDQNFLEITQEIAQDIGVRYEARCDCGWTHFNTIVYALLREYWGTENITTHDPRDFTATNDISQEYAIRGHFYMRGGDQSRELVDGNYRRSLFDSIGEAKLYSNLISLLGNSRISISTHVSPRDIFPSFDINTVQRLAEAGRRQTLYQGIEHSVISGENQSTNFWYNTSFDFVIGNPGRKNYHRPALIVEFDGYGGYINHQGEYILPDWTWNNTPNMRRNKMNQKIEWARQFSIPLFVVRPPSAAHAIELTETASGEERVVRLQAEFSILQAIRTNTPIELNRTGPQRITGLYENRNISDAFPYQRIIEIIERYNDQNSEFGVSYEEPIPYELEYQWVTQEEAIELFEGLPQDIEIPAELVWEMFEGNLRTRLAICTFNDYIDCFSAPPMYTSQSDSEGNFEIPPDLFVHTRFLKRCELTGSGLQVLDYLQNLVDDLEESGPN